MKTPLLIISGSPASHRADAAFRRHFPDGETIDMSTESGRRRLEELHEAWVSGWLPIDSAPKDRPIIVFCPGREGLNALVSLCLWHEDAGFCVDELREPTLWTYLPVPEEEGASEAEEGESRG